MTNSLAQGIVVLGTGRLGSALAQRIFEVQLPLRAVYNRHLHKAQVLATTLGIPATDRVSALPTDAFLYLLALSDDAIGPFAQCLSQHLPADALVAHTSGATPLAVLQPHFSRCAIFYPLQSFAPGRSPDWTHIPICLSANAPQWTRQLWPIAQRVGGAVYELDDAQRGQLHLAAVFANNFTNFCYHIASQLLKMQHLPFDILLPLIRETVERLHTAPPQALQTGPAVRNDRATIARHLSALQHHPDYQQLYRLMTELIGRYLGSTFNESQS